MTITILFNFCKRYPSTDKNQHHCELTLSVALKPRFAFWDLLYTCTFPIHCTFASHRLISPILRRYCYVFVPISESFWEGGIEYYNPEMRASGGFSWKHSNSIRFFSRCPSDRSGFFYFFLNTNKVLISWGFFKNHPVVLLCLQRRASYWRESGDQRKGWFGSFYWFLHARDSRRHCCIIQSSRQTKCRKFAIPCRA